MRILVQSSYGLPLVLSFITMVVEFTAPECASFRPKFNMGHCFFSGKVLSHISHILENVIRWYIDRKTFHAIEFFFIICFVERLSKGIWFYIPMGVSLLINVGAFVSIVRTLIKMNNSLKELKLNRNNCEKTNRYTFQHRNFVK